MNVRCLVIGGGPELDTTRCTIAQRPTPVWVKGGIAERRETLFWRPVI